MNVIDKARERIERDGWWQDTDGGSGYGPNDEACIARAVLDECQPNEYYDAARAIEWATGLTGTNVIAWNDDPSTSLEDVLLVMKRASARLDQERAS